MPRIWLRKTENRFIRVSECGRVSVELMKESKKTVFKWRFDYPPLNGTKYDFIAFVRPYPCHHRDKRQRRLDRIRARNLFDGLEDGLDADVGLVRKPKDKAWKYRRPKQGRRDGAKKYVLRDTIEHRHGKSQAVNICKMVHPETPYKKLNADQIFEALYAERWAGTYGKSLFEWGGMLEVSL